MNQKKALNQVRARRTRRNRAKISGSALRPRLAVSRSNKSISAQIIDDEKGRTLVHVSGKEANDVGQGKTKSEKARLAGELLAKKAVAAGIKAVVFDRRGYKYHGRVLALAEGAKKGGLKI